MIMKRDRQKIILASVESKLRECSLWLDSVKQTQAEQPVMSDSDDCERQLAEIQVSVFTELVRICSPRVP